MVGVIQRGLRGDLAALIQAKDGLVHGEHTLSAAGSSEGMISMDQALTQLYRAGRISRETALEYAANSQQLQRSLG